jgi:VCBS repeat-containing protein
MNAARAGNTAPKQRKKRRWPLTVAIVTLLLLLFCSGSVAAFYTFAYPATAVVTITPTGKVEQNTFTIMEVTGNADAAQHQVAGARMITASQSQTQSGVATGQGQTNGTTASGFVTLENDTSDYIYYTKLGGTLVSNSGITIVCDQVITVYPGQRGVFEAYAATAGSAGNIPAYNIDITQTNGNGTIKVYNTAAFSGGQNGGTYPIVQQSDINTVASSLEPTLQQSVQATLQKQLQTNEKMAGTPNCTAKVTSDKAAGAAASNVNVTVTETCTGEAYNPAAAQALAATLLQTQASSSLDPRYALARTITTTVSQIVVSNSKTHTLALTIAASGQWDYSFNAAQQQALARLIAGKSQQDAQALLAQQTGINATAITISGAFLFWNGLPANLDHIKIMIK